ncbi:MAG: methyltransferase domain-containing protein [Planctomycetes bacterium]|nr:methyltransferase domain-containing protein [Planctomycetota bacterium]
MTRGLANHVAPLADHAGRMDRMYRFTRHVYDASRKYYLLGRDQLLSRIARDMDGGSGVAVCEIGCGTARNLIKLARLNPALRLFGLDAAQSMLDTAAASLKRAGLTDRVTLRRALAEQLDHRRTFDRDHPFNAVFFSYALSMMPTWPAAIDAALANLAPAGRLYIVDFCDQADLPRAFAGLLKRWLALFHVHHRPELLAHLHSLQAAGRIELELTYLYRRYAFCAVIRDGYDPAAQKLQSPASVTR